MWNLPKWYELNPNTCHRLERPAEKQATAPPTIVTRHCNLRTTRPQRGEGCVVGTVNLTSTPSNRWDRLLWSLAIGAESISFPLFPCFRAHLNFGFCFCVVHKFLAQVASLHRSWTTSCSPAQNVSARLTVTNMGYGLNTSHIAVSI